MLVEQVAGSPWNGWPDAHGIRGRITVVRAFEPIKTQLADAQNLQIPWDVSCIGFTLDE